jgi:hypothetical protein
MTDTRSEYLSIGKENLDGTVETRMKFTVAGNRIICSRKDNTVANAAAYRHAVMFDAQVESVPPHVSAKLVTGEIEQLNDFMADRKRCQENSAVKNLLETIPGLLGEAADILNSVERVNPGIYGELSEAIKITSRALDSVKPESRGEPAAVNNMRYSEAQKARLVNIR